MQTVSNEYKEIMNRMIRNRAYMTVSIGVVNNQAQNNAKVTGTAAYWSDSSLLFKNTEINSRYATLEQDFLQCDGTMCFVPEDNENAQFLQDRCFVTANILDTVEIKFNNLYDIKGLTIEFDANAFPTKFNVIGRDFSKTYTNTQSKFVTEDVIGNTEYIKIVPLEMNGGQQRTRINNILAGVGLTFGNDEITDSSIEEFVHSVCEELSSINFSVTISDDNNRFNVDDDNSFINYLDTMQKLAVSVGLEMDDGSSEWMKLATVFMDDWKSQKGTMNFIAKDRISFLTDIYRDGNTIHTRTLYDDAVAVLTFEGLEADEYILDECLKDVTITNPLPESACNELLQLIANAGRCILYQNRDGKVCIKANFANVIDPDDLIISTDTVSAWAHPENIIKGSDYVYADMTSNFISMDGSMYFMPEDDNYLQTSFVSSEIAKDDGTFDNTPNISIELPAGYVYYSVLAKFDGNPPKEMLVTTYYNEEKQEEVIFTDLQKDNILYHEFIKFDKMLFSFPKAEANNRVLVNKISFGDLSDYTLTKQNMMEEPIGYREKKTKDVLVKIFTFTNNSEGEPEQKDDSVYYTQSINTTGSVITFENSLISSTEHAQMVAEWLGNYYANNVSYSVNYRGEPRLNTADIIYMESDVLSNLQVEIERSVLTFNGAFGGNLELRRALRMMGE